MNRRWDAILPQKDIPDISRNLSKDLLNRLVILTTNSMG